MSAASNKKLEVFFEKALASGDELWDKIQASMQSMTDAEVETLADRAAELYSGAAGDPIRHLIAEVTADEYGRRFNEPEQTAACNVVAFPKARTNPDAAGKIARRKSLAGVLGGDEIWPDGDGAA